MLNVFTNTVPVGSLRRVTEAIRPRHEFIYHEGTAGADAVSLLMPPAPTPYGMDGGRLHPVFDMNLPEGDLRAAIVRLFSKALPIFDDLTLLEIVGGSLIGRLRFGATQEPIKAENIRGILHYRGTAGLFRDLLERYAKNSGISGVQPKLLLRDDGGLMSEQFSPLKPADRITASGTTHIIKTFDPVQFPALAANEFLCLQAAKAAGLPIPTVHLADDGGMLAVERFDLRADGSYCAFEDLCSLAGRVSADKYQGSYEQVARTLAQILRGPDGVQAGMRQFFKTLTLSLVVGNGDAHRKNFGVLYEDATEAIRLAPVYDVLTTGIYIPGDALALTLDGKKTWPDAKRVERFGVQRCQLTPKDAKDALAEVLQGVADTRRRFAEVSLPGEVADKMQVVWENGLARLRADR